MDFESISISLKSIIVDEFEHSQLYLEAADYENLLFLILLLFVYSLSWYYLELYKNGHYYLVKCFEVLKKCPFPEWIPEFQKSFRKWDPVVIH